MLSKHVTKIVQSLEKKKFRDKYNLFKVEGDKLVRELLLSDLKTELLLASPEWLATCSLPKRIKEIIEVSEREMSAVSNFQSLPEVIAVAEIPERRFSENVIQQSLSLVLNGIQDPGNLGTILRVADWFGIRHVFCDSDCANTYNPKCVQASMGAVFRVNVFYLDLIPLLQRLRDPAFPCYGTFLDGSNIYETPLENKGFIIMGNEGKGIRAELEPYIGSRLTIPSFAGSKYSTESLNVGVATGIVLSEFRRRNTGGTK